jgi:hypothetical protein
MNSTIMNNYIQDIYKQLARILYSKLSLLFLGKAFHPITQAQKP